MLNLYAYVRNNPLRYVDPNGLELFVFGSAAREFVHDLELATGLKLDYDPLTGKVTFLGAEPDPAKLTGDALQLYNLIKDQANVVRMYATEILSRSATYRHTRRLGRRLTAGGKASPERKGSSLTTSSTMRTLPSTTSHTDLKRRR